MVKPRKIPKIDLLKRRRDYLRRQVADAKDEDYAYAWDEAEANALDWAVKNLEALGITGEEEKV